jgi:hypothetical protein
MPASTGRPAVMVVSLSGIASAPNYLVSYAAPSITSVTGCNQSRTDPLKIYDCSRHSSSLITIDGDNFGASGLRVLIGASVPNCLQSLTAPHQSVVCEVQAGALTSQPILLLQAGGALVPTKASLSFAPCPAGTLIGTGTDCDPCMLLRFSDLVCLILTVRTRRSSRHVQP